MDKELYTVSEAAKKLGVSANTIRTWDRNGAIKTVRTVGNQRRIPVSEVERLLGTESWKQ